MGGLSPHMLQMRGLWDAFGLSCQRQRVLSLEKPRSLPPLQQEKVQQRRRVERRRRVTTKHSRNIHCRRTTHLFGQSTDRAILLLFFNARQFFREKEANRSHAHPQSKRNLSIQLLDLPSSPMETKALPSHSSRPT